MVLRDAAGKTRLVMDTKWKVSSNGFPSDDDLKQMFVYNELLGSVLSVLLYPRTSQSFAAGGGYARREHGCEQRHVGVLDGTRWSTATILRALRDILTIDLVGSAA